MSDGENTARLRKSRRNMHKQKYILKEQPRVITSNREREREENKQRKLRREKHME